MDDEYDVFICHASGDKDEVARPLAQMLKQRGVRVWYDEFVLGMGDDLQATIGKGLARSRFGVVILSPAFFERPWPQWELGGLHATQMAERKQVILPVWHKVDVTTVIKYSPSLANLKALDTGDGIAQLSTKIADLLNVQKLEPYSRVYRDQAVRIMDIAGPKALIQDHAFVRCTLVGPAVLLILDNVSFDGVRFEANSIWPLDEKRDYIGGIYLQKSFINECNFVNLGFGFPIQALREVMKGVQLIGEGPKWFDTLMESNDAEEGFDQLITTVVAAATGDERAAAALSTFLSHATDNDERRNTLARVFQRIVAGEREDELLTGLTDIDTAITRMILDRLNNAST